MPQNISFHSKSQLVLESLRRDILEGHLKPGSRLVIEDLAAMLGVSQIPVREALQQLQADGFVIIEPYLGATVTRIHDDLISEIFDLLEAMEVISSRAACQRMSDKDLDEVEHLLRDMDAIVDDADRWSTANARLHLLIGERAGTLLVHTLMMKALDHWDRLRRQYPEGVSLQPARAAQEEHWRLLEALRKRDVDQVEQVIRAHNRTARAAYADVLDKAGQKAAVPALAEVNVPDKGGRALAP